MKLTRTLALLAAVVGGLAVSACESARRVAAPRPAEHVAAGATPARTLELGLLACTPISADSTTVAIGSAGGTISVGPHRLIVPAGALDSTVDITAIAPSDTVNRVILLPSGLTFSQPATLELSYSNCGVLSLLPLHRVVYLDESFSILDILPSLDNVFTRKVSTGLQHFSDYAVAW